jgi:hypothetical protein
MKRETPVGLFDVVKRRSSTPDAAARRPEDRGVRTAVRIALLAGVVPVVLAACGSSAAAPASKSDTSSTVPTKASASAYSACLRQHGVTIPNFTHSTGVPPTSGGTRPSFSPGSFGGGFRNNPAFAKAAAACKSLRPSGGFGGFGGGAGGFNSTAFAAYRNCLKLHGLTLPTGGAPRAGAGSTPPTTFDQSSPTVQAALAACAALRPTASTTTTTVTT